MHNSLFAVTHTVISRANKKIRAFKKKVNVIIVGIAHYRTPCKGGAIFV